MSLSYTLDERLEDHLQDPGFEEDHLQELEDRLLEDRLQHLEREREALVQDELTLDDLKKLLLDNARRRLRGA